MTRREPLVVTVLVATVWVLVVMIWVGLLLILAFGNVPITTIP